MMEEMQHAHNGGRYAMPSGVNISLTGYISCFVCSKLFQTVSERDQHVYTHGKKCSDCVKVFYDEHSFKNHKHLTDRRWPCSVCSKAFNHEDELNEHNKTHNDEVKNKKVPAKVILFQCCVCKLVFQDKLEANKHMQIHITPADTQRALLSRLHLVATAKDITKPGSSSCQQSCLTQDGSKVENPHIYSQFAVVEPATSSLQNMGNNYECKVCSKLFSSLLNRNQHLSTHMDKPLKPKLESQVSSPATVSQSPVTLPVPVLEIQSKVSLPVSVIQTAMSPVMSGTPSTTYECTLCGQTFSSLSERNHHLNTHVGQPLYKCPKCRRLFANLTLYATHVKTHSKQSPHVTPEPKNNIKFIIKPPATLHAIKPATTSLSVIRPTISIIKPGPSTIKAASASITKTTTTASHKFTCQVCSLDCKTLSDWMSHMSSHTWESLPGPQTTGQTKDNNSSTDSASETETNEQKTWMETETIYDKITNSTGDIDPNIQIKTEPEAQVCVLCGEEYGTWEELNTHLQVHGVQKQEPDDNMFNTPETIKRFSVYDKVIISRKTVDKSRYKCPCCSKGFLCPSDLRKHMMTHTGERPYVCCVCGMAFKHVHAFNIHFAKHVKENPHGCALCQQVRENSEDLMDHIMSHTKDAAVPQCAYCGKDFGRHGILRQHIATHIGAQVYKCMRCHIDFSTKAALQEHVLIHNGGKPLQCSICNQRFTWPATLYRHIRHRNCKQFRQSSSAPTADMDAYEDEVKKEINELISGKKQAVDNQKKDVPAKIPYTCIHCAEEFSQYSEYKMHMKTHETRKKSNTCPYCRRTYRNRHKLRKHVAGHTCKCCGKIFTRMVDMRKHLMTAKEATHVCFICKKSFNHSSILKRHLKTHTDMNTYEMSCFKCGRQFRCQDSFAEHKCHSKRYIRCATCVKGFVTVKELESHLKVHINTKGRHKHKQRRRRVI